MELVNEQKELEKIRIHPYLSEREQLENKYNFAIDTLFLFRLVDPYSQFCRKKLARYFDINHETFRHIIKKAGFNLNGNEDYSENTERNDNFNLLNPKVSESMKNIILEYHDGNCFFCKEILLGKPTMFTDFHHAKMRCNKGRTDIDNVVPVCKYCHHIMHKKAQPTYQEIRERTYRIFCWMLDLIPCESYFDDDAFAYEERLEQGEEIPKKWAKLIMGLKMFDYLIGFIDNKEYTLKLAGNMNKIEKLEDKGIENNN